MTVGGHSEVDRLVERGLERYGLGDIDGALAAWQDALNVDPEDLRAGAYLDYVRENYAMLTSGASRTGEHDVPFDLGAVPGDDDYEVEITRGEQLARVERYIESVDEGWFLDDELPPPPEPAPARSSTRHLPLPATRTPTEEGLTLELEADEPSPGELDPSGMGGIGLEEEATRDFVFGADFRDQRSAAPTREVPAPSGFIKATIQPVPSPAQLAAEEARSAAATAEIDEDILGTRPGRGIGLEQNDPVSRQLAAEALAAFGAPGTGGDRLGPEDRTRETPHLRLTLPVGLEETGELPRGLASELGDEERTIERSSTRSPNPLDLGRADTMSETTLERGGATYTMPAPLDGSADQSGHHPPLVIIEDQALELNSAGEGRAPTSDGHDDDGAPHTRAARADESELDTADRKLPVARPGDDLSPPTERLRGGAALPPTPDAPAARAQTIDGGGSIDALAVQLAEALAAAAPPDEGPADRTRRRVTWLIDRASLASGAGDHATAIVALDLALREDPESAVTQKLLHRHQPAILDVYQRYVGDIGAHPRLAIPMHQLAGERIETRAAFLLSRIDGSLTFEEILDVSGMQRLEAFRHLSLLLLRGILEVR